MSYKLSDLRAASRAFARHSRQVRNLPCRVSEVDNHLVLHFAERHILLERLWTASRIALDL